MTKRFIRSARLLAVLCAAAAALILFGAVGVSAAGEVPAVYTPKDEPPFTVLADKGENGEIKIGCDLGIYKGRQKKYFLFLPATADPRCLTVRYDGKKGTPRTGRGAICYLPQNPALLFARDSVKEELEETARALPDGEEAIGRVAERLCRQRNAPGYRPAPELPENLR